MARAAAWLFNGLAGLVVAFQFALAAGAPWGELTWGGRFPGVLPPAMRAVATFSAVLLLLFAGIVSSRAGVFGAAAHRRAPIANWIVVAYCALGVLANATTPSARERLLWLPVVSAMFVASGWIAIQGGRDRSTAG